MSRSIKLALIICALSALSTTASSQSVELLQAFGAFETARAAQDNQAAIILGDEALRLLEAQGSTNPQESIDLLRNLAEANVTAGQLVPALLLYERALNAQEAMLGPLHPDLVKILQPMQELEARQQHYAAAEILQQRIVAIERGVYGDQHAIVLASMAHLRDLYRSAGRDADAVRVDSEIDKLSITSRGNPPTRTAAKNERRYTPENGFANVRIFYGTNRARTGDARPAVFYGKTRADKVEVGFADVSIPETHRIGELETQGRWTMMSYMAGQVAAEKRFVLLQKVSPQSESQFVSTLRQQIKSSTLKDVFVFVHGFNTSFEDAARRTAQLAYDLDFDGTPMMYSWPSQGSTTAYTVDESVVDTSGRRLAEFLETVTSQSGAERVHLIAHSMGNRALIGALNAYLAKRAPTQRRGLFGQIVFTAPDVDRDYFLDVVKTLQDSAARITLYASDNDLALKTSQKIHGFPRAGLAGANIISLPGLDTIDMSAVQGDMLGHTYFAADSGAIYDLFRLLWRGDPPPKRCGMSEEAKRESPVWRFDVQACQGGDLMQAGLMLKRFGGRARARIDARLRALTDP
ncbi:MAG: alpha/beta fold hydrolase, partial [Steroidobacteraceae bacterium]